MPATLGCAAVRHQTARRRAVGAVLAVLAGLLPTAGSAPAAAGGPSLCGPGRTALGGTLVGHPDGAPLNATVNVELTDARTARAYDVPDGQVDTVGRPAGRRYSTVDHVNPERTAATAAEHSDRTWGAAGSSGPVCFTTNSAIALAYIEVYPRRPVDDDGDGRTDRHVTDRSAYGAAAHYRQAVRPGADNTGIVLRLPQHVPSQVGAVHGFVTHRGRAVPLAAPGCGTTGRPACEGITAVRAFPTALHGPGCGIEGFSASADRVDPGARGGTYYRIAALAGGRCGARTQSYAVRVTCVRVCGPGPGGSTTRTVAPASPPAVRAGAVARADLSFG